MKLVTAGKARRAPLHGPLVAARATQDGMMAFYVDTTKCRKDGICAAVCPVGIIRGKAGELPVLDDSKAGRCIRCGQCMAFCPTQACSAPGLSLDDCRFLRPELYPSTEELEELVFSRRSIRNFKNKPVPRDVFERITDSCRWTPTGHNRQAYRWIILESRDEVAAFLEIFFAWLERLPEVDPEEAKAAHATGVVRAWRERGLDVITRGAPHIVITAGPEGNSEWTDGTVALTYFELLAQSLGVGCMWSGYFLRMFRHASGTAAREYLGLKPGELAYGAQIVGYPKFTAVSRPPRNPARIVWK